MRFIRLPMRDPRTVARDIPGICDILFPRLLPGLVGLLNRSSESFDGAYAVAAEDMLSVNVSPAMLFEVAVAKAEQMISNSPDNMEECIQRAFKRQSKYFDAIPSYHLSGLELSIIHKTADNLVLSLNMLAAGNDIITSPQVPGFEWIATGVGDFSVGCTLIEVKCTSKGFSSSDYRQLLIYWLLSYASSIEKGTVEWQQGVLLNPRTNRFINFEFNELIHVVTGGCSKVEIFELFRSIVSDYSSKQYMRL